MTDGNRKAGASSKGRSGRPAFQSGPTHIPYRILLLGKMIDRVTAQHIRDTAEVANVACSDRAEVSRAIGSLEQRWLVQREANPRNRKSSLVSLTAEGKSVHAAIRGDAANSSSNG
jgi:DNA-binding MarR family transcriptional regulator